MVCSSYDAQRIRFNPFSGRITSTVMIARSLAAASLKPMVLAILDQEEEYGYRIIQRIQGISKGDIEWTTGTLYPFLHGLENEGLVESHWRSVANAPRRKYYALTPMGDKAAAFEKQQWLRVSAMLSKLWGSEPSGQVALVPASS